MVGAYPPGTLVRVLLNPHHCNVPSKLSANYSGLCVVVETRGSLLMLQELDTQRVITANHDAVRHSKVTLPAVLATHAACAAPLPPVARAAPNYRLSRQHLQFARPIFKYIVSLRRASHN